MRACEIGVAEPPTIAEMENELKTLPNEIDSDGDSTVDSYIDKTPLQKSSWGLFSIIGIAIIILTIIVIIGIGIYCCYCRSETSEHIRRIDSDTSNRSNIS
jgi:hypothetical protein